MKKRGIGAIVATVLMILIVVAGVMIVYTVILPMFNGLDELEFSNVQMGVLLEGYTFYDDGYVFVQVKRGADDKVLAGLEIDFVIEGNSVSYKLDEEDGLPAPGEKKIYAFNLEKEGYGAPDSVSVAPIFLVSGKEVRGTVSSKVLVPQGTAPLSFERYKDKSKDRVSEDNPLNGCVKVGDFEENCGDGVDDDCDGDIDMSDWDCNHVGWGKVTKCGDLPDNGAPSHYVLMNDLVVGSEDLIGDSCFTTSTQEIIFDLGGHTISGPDSGIAFNPQENSGYVLIENGQLNGFENPIKFTSSNSYVDNMIIQDSISTAILFVAESESLTITSTVILSSGENGIEVSPNQGTYAGFIYFKNVIVRDSVSNGYLLGGEAYEQNSWDNVTLYHNGQSGAISQGYGSSNGDSVYSKINASLNGLYGFHQLKFSQGSQISDSVFFDNGNVGLYVNNGDDLNNVSSCYNHEFDLQGYDVTSAGVVIDLQADKFDGLDETYEGESHDACPSR